MRRIIVHGLRPEFKGIITVTWGWATEPTLSELENLLANEEDLEKPLSSLTIKDEDKALFSKRQDYQKREVEKSSRPLGDQKNQHKKNGEVLQLWKERTLRQILLKDEEEVWDFETSYAVEETNQQEEPATCHFNKEDELALANVSEKLVDYEHDWIIDSGCFNHMTGDEKKLINMSEYKDDRVVVTANNSKMPISHIGKTVHASSQLKTSGTSKCLPRSRYEEKLIIRITTNRFW
ncbi:hypothetical protein KY290_038269 [Solanum tuberosum]|uniref:Retrovirus-related Pol polyprotein from transposon TNT 1-94-like beta-barrel domain-containing protein n=1 Tax=Solanum tuberosum TaxID=4113 RepID=A0ABQ7TZX9_SOLTU|nr:hypothetical protein KY290_038269 [Solanum tuberosum]